jgi:hypothetical protein
MNIKHNCDSIEKRILSYCGDFNMHRTHFYPELLETYQILRSHCALIQASRPRTRFDPLFDAK